MFEKMWTAVHWLTYSVRCNLSLTKGNFQEHETCIQHTQMCYCSSGKSDRGSWTAPSRGSPEREPGLHARMSDARSVWHRAWQCREYSIVLGFPCWTCRLCQRVIVTPQACSQCSGQWYYDGPAFTRLLYPTYGLGRAVAADAWVPVVILTGRRSTQSLLDAIVHSLELRLRPCSPNRIRAESPAPKLHEAAYYGGSA